MAQAAVQQPAPFNAQQVQVLAPLAPVADAFIASVQAAGNNSQVRFAILLLSTSLISLDPPETRKRQQAPC